MGLVDAGLGLTAWLRMGLQNTTGTDVTVNYRLYAWDNACRVIWDGTTLQSNPAFDTTGTFTVAAGTTGTIELFYTNDPTTYNPADQGECAFMMDALDQAGVVFVDAGR